MNQLRKGLAVR